MSTPESRRGFLAKLGALATAPVVTAYAADEQTGIALPSRQLVTATELPPPLVISSSTGTMPITGTMSLGDPVWSHMRLHQGDGTLVFVVDGERWVIPAFKIP